MTVIHNTNDESDSIDEYRDPEAQLMSEEGARYVEEWGW